MIPSTPKTSLTVSDQERLVPFGDAVAGLLDELFESRVDLLRDAFWQLRTQLRGG